MSWNGEHFGSSATHDDARMPKRRRIPVTAHARRADQHKFRAAARIPRFSVRSASLKQINSLPPEHEMLDHVPPGDEYFMRWALREAERALAHEDVPIGAVIVSGGEVVAAGHNE